MPSLVTLGTLITRTRQRWNGEGDNSVTDWEIADSLNTSLAVEFYDVVRQAVGDNYFRNPYIITMQQGIQSYDLPSDHLSLMSVDVWTSPIGTVIPYGSPGSTMLKINARRYMEYERNYYQQILLGWSVGATVLYSLTGPQITFQPTPVQAFAVQLNYVPVFRHLGGGQLMLNGVPQGRPANYNDTLDDINGWAELGVLDAAAKCALKKRQYDAVAAFGGRLALMRQKVASVISLRHAGEPERPNMPFARGMGDGWLE